MTAVPLAAVLSDRRCWLLILSSVLSVALAFFAIPDRWALLIVQHAGFWLVLVAFVIWVWALGRAFLDDIRALRWRTIDWASVAIVAAGGVVLLVHETFGFKIIMDELMLLGTSMSMHFDKMVLTPLRGNDIQGAFMIVEGIVDKRPLFFPFLLSLVHDVAGYRPENAFILNGVLTFVFLGLTCYTGRRIAGRAAGWLAVLLMAGLPLLGQNCTGGGFELLYLVMILATLLLGARYAERRDAPSLTAFCYAGLLLAQVRYESPIFLLPVALLLLWVWFSSGEVDLSWPVIFAPLLLVHVPLHQRIFDMRSSAWEMFSKPGYSEPFSIRYIPENIQHALKYFFGAASDVPNSFVLSALGWIAVPFCALLLVKRLRTLRSAPAFDAAVTMFAVGFAAQFVLMMVYFWGKFDDAVTCRLSLPTHLGLVIAVLVVLPQFGKPIVMRVLLGIAIVGLLARSVPSMAAHAYSQEYLAGREVAWRRAFMAKQPHPDYLMIDNDATLWVTHLVSATPTVIAVKRREDIAFHMRNRTFSAVYVFQRLNIDANTGEKTLRKDDDLGPSFVLEPVTEERLQVLTVSRISRVKEIKLGEESLTAGPTKPPPPLKSRAEVEKARQAFLESYMKKLP